jgi:hypothetical protein
MVNVHLNGDLVRMPDISAAKKRAYELRDKKHICKYNVYENSCASWQNSLKCWQNVKDFNNTGRCMLSGSDLCPGHVSQKKQGEIKKTFKIDNPVYRKLSSAAHDLVKSSQKKTLFLTLTFPPFKHNPTENEINHCFSKFVENLRENYSCSGYVAVREYGENTHRVHYHILCSLPYTDFVTLNRAWCHAISNISDFAGNAIRTTKETLFIHNPGRALRYVCKYFAKSKYTTSSTRIVFISNNLIKNPIRLKINVTDLLSGFKGIYINQTSDYTTCFRITNPEEFDRFCKEFLYDAFEKEFNYPLFSKKNPVFYSPGSG